MKPSQNFREEMSLWFNLNTHRHLKCDKESQKMQFIMCVFVYKNLILKSN